MKKRYVILAALGFIFWSLHLAALRRMWWTGRNHHCKDTGKDGPGNQVYNF